jgi:hypothetical protein
VILVAFGALVLASLLVAARAMPESTRLERACAASVILPALAIGIVYVLGAARALHLAPFLAVTLFVAFAALAVGGTTAWAVLWGDAIAVRDAVRELVREPPSVGAVTIGAIAVVLAAFAAYLLAPWSWDSLSHHLPIVHDALQTGTLRRIPTSVVYVNTYPRLVDVFFVAWRVALSDDTWIELGQLPFAIGGVLAIATIAERAGVPAGRALALSSLWLAVPATMLLLASASVDVAVASLVLLSFALATASPRPGTIVVAGVAIGLLLGSRGSAAPIAIVAAILLLVRASRANEIVWGALASGVALAIGVWKYVENWIEWGNPVWPTDLRLGPIALPGKVSLSALVTAGMHEPYASEGWAGRLVSSWTALPSSFAYDMRIGGFGPLFTFALLPLAIAVPVAAWRSPVLRARAWDVAIPVGLVVLTTIASPGAHWARYTLAIPGALLALAIATTGALPRTWRITAEAGAVALAAIGLIASWRGLSAGGPHLFELARMAPHDRVSARGIDDQEVEWQRARQRVGRGEAFAYDWSYSLPGRLWRSDGTGRVAFLPVTTPTFDELTRWVSLERVRVIVLGVGPTGAADTAREHPERFRLLFRSAHPETQAFEVFEVIGD